MFYKVVVFESFTEFTGKHLRWSHLESQLLSSEVFFLITPQNQATLQRKQIGKLT